METFYIKKIKEFTKAKKRIEKKLGLTITIKDHRVTVQGDSIDEYAAEQVFDAINFGFSITKALELADAEVVFKRIHIKEFTKRNLKDVKARLIGTHGKTRKTLSEISGCEVKINESEVGILGDVENVDDVYTAVVHIIKGSKQSNMYKFLERMNREKKNKHPIE